MIHNIVFDIGNVLVSFQPKIYFKEVLLESCDEICDMVFASAWWRDYDNGLCTLREVKCHLIEAHPDKAKEIQTVCDDWFALMEPITAMWEFRQACRAKGYGIYIISNLSEDSYVYLQKKYRLFDDIEGRVLSFEEKFGKPDPRMYQLLCERYAIVPSSCLFLDDRLPNIMAASAMGMSCVHVQDIARALTKAREILC